MSSPQHPLLLSSGQLQDLGLSLQPFDHTAQHFSFYLSDSLTMLLNVVQHNLFESNVLQIIKGEEGIGKSCFSHLLRQTIKEKTVNIIIQGHHNLHASDIFQQMLLLFQTEQSHSLKECLITLAHHLKKSIKENHIVVVIIDDSDKIQSKNLEYILQSLEALNDVLRQKLSVVLLGENKLESMLNNLAVKHIQQGKVQSLLLRPLNPQQYKEYLQHLLNNAHSVEPLSLTDSQIEQLHKQSHGIPGLLNKAWLDLYFMKNKTRPFFWQNTFQSLRQKPKHIVIPALVLLLVFITLNLITNKLPQEHVKEQIKTLPVRVTPENAKNSPSITERNQTLQAKEILSPTAPISPPEKTDITAATVTSGLKSKPEDKIAKSTSLKNKRNDKTTETSITEITKKTIPNHQNYTIQLLASSQKKLMEQYIHQHFKSGMFLYYKKKLNKKVTLYILLHGNYQSLEQARKVVENYPEDIKKNKPWIRRFKSIQKSIME